MLVVERLAKYWAEPFIGNRKKLHKSGRLNQSSTTRWGDAQSWTGPLFFKHVVQNWNLMRWDGVQCSDVGLTKWSLVCPVSLGPVPQQWGAAHHSGWGGWNYGAGMVPGGT